MRNQEGEEQSSGQGDGRRDKAGGAKKDREEEEISSCLRALHNSDGAVWSGETPEWISDPR
jgi:hypothetical protein